MTIFKVDLCLCLPTLISHVMWTTFHMLEKMVHSWLIIEYKYSPCKITPTTQQGIISFHLLGEPTDSGALSRVLSRPASEAHTKCLHVADAQLG